MLTHRLRDVRRQKKLTQMELARMCDLGINQINKYENGANEPTLTILKRIAQALGISIDFLAGLTDDPQGFAAPSDMKPEEREILDAYRREGWAGIVHLGVDKITK